MQQHNTDRPHIHQRLVRFQHQQERKNKPQHVTRIHGGAWMAPGLVALAYQGTVVQHKRTPILQRFNMALHTCRSEYHRGLQWLSASLPSGAAILKSGVHTSELQELYVP